MVKIIEAPSPLVELEEVKVALGESGSDRDALIAALILAAQGELDGPNGWVGFSAAQQVAQITASAFDPCIRLIGGPVASAIVTYLDAAGDEQTLPNTDYIVGSDGSVSLIDGSVWPTLAGQSNAVTVTYHVGIDDPDDPRVALMKVAIIMHVRMTLDMVEPEMSRKAVEAILRPLWVIP